MKPFNNCSYYYNRSPYLGGKAEFLFWKKHMKSEALPSETSAVMAPNLQRGTWWEMRQTGFPVAKHMHWDNARVTATDNAVWTTPWSPLSEPPQVPEQTDPSTQWHVEVRGHDDPCLFWLTPRNVSNCRARSVWTVIKVRFSSARTLNSSLSRAISMFTLSSSTSSAINSFLKGRNDTCWRNCCGDYNKLVDFNKLCPMMYVFVVFLPKAGMSPLILLRYCVEDIMFRGLACQIKSDEMLNPWTKVKIKPVKIMYGVCKKIMPVNRNAKENEDLSMIKSNEPFCWKFLFFTPTL